MRNLALAASIVCCLSIIGLAQPGSAAVAPEIDPHASLGVVQQWIYNYRAKPDYGHIPAAVRVLFHTQTFREPENAGIYLGFIDGAIGSNPAKAEQLVDSFFPVPPEDEWVIVRAIAYSGLPDWRNLLRKIEPKMPGRRVMIDAYLSAKLPTLWTIPLEEAKPGTFDKLRSVFTNNPFKKQEKKLDMTLSYANNQDLLDTLWGSRLFIRFGADGECFPFEFHARRFQDAHHGFCDFGPDSIARNQRYFMIHWVRIPYLVKSCGQPVPRALWF